MLRPRQWLELSRSLAIADPSFTRFGNPLPLSNTTRITRPLRLNACRTRRRQLRSYSTGVEDGRMNATAPQKREQETSRQDKKSEPLRILFCGSDEFSCASLRELHNEHVQNPTLIQSIDVVVRPGKRTGRGLKAIQHPPLRDLATELGLPIHERDTFTGWDMPGYINLIIAVSFGLFVPRRLLRDALYGGLNVHPSVLPDLRGPAPIQHALLAGREHTGVTLQTLDAERFDHGLALARSDPIYIPEEADFKSLLRQLTSVGADLLVRGLREGVHVPPLAEVPIPKPAPRFEPERSYSPELSLDSGRNEKREAWEKSPTTLLHAPKITKHDRQLRPEHLPHVLRRYRALGPLWFWSHDRNGSPKRIIIDEATGALPPCPRPPRYPLTVNVNAPAGGLSATDSQYGYEFWNDPQFMMVPFLQDPDQGAAGGVYLLLWFPGNDDGGACYLGDCRLEMLKVEGDKLRPAKGALREFFVSMPGGVAGTGPMWAVGERTGTSLRGVGAGVGKRE